MKEITTIRVSKEVSKYINLMKGHNGCVTADDVINYLIKKVEEANK